MFKTCNAIAEQIKSLILFSKLSTSTTFLLEKVDMTRLRIGRTCSGLDPFYEKWRWKTEDHGCPSLLSSTSFCGFGREHFSSYSFNLNPVSPDVEALMYSSAQEMGITVISISHWYTLSKYHSLLLKIGEGSDGKEWFLESISSSNTLIESVDNEIKKIKATLGDTEQLKRRLKQINKENDYMNFLWNTILSSSPYPPFSTHLISYPLRR